MQEDNPSTSAITNKNKKKVTQPLNCSICGDKASGCFYEVASCYGCKNFFRRAVVQQLRFICKKDGACEETRIRCRACRFDRCVEAGMNPLLVDAVKDKNANRVIRDTLLRREKAGKSTSQSMTIYSGPKSLEVTVNRLINELIYLDNTHQKLRRSQFNPTPRPDISVAWCLNGQSRMSIDFGEMPVQYPPPSLHMPFLPMAIRIRDRVPMTLRPIQSTSPTFKKWSMVELMYTIEWLKTFTFFNRMVDREKVQLIKNVSQMVADFTAAFYSYDVLGKEVTTMPDGTVLIQGELPKEASVERATNFGLIYRIREIGMDRKEYVLLKAIMAFDPHDEIYCAETRAELQHQREIFSKSLMSYLLERRGPTKGPFAYTQMLSLMTWQMQMIRKHKDLFVLLLAYNLTGPWLPQILIEILSPS